MIRRLRIATFISALLSLAPSAFSQVLPRTPLPADLANIIPYTGLSTTGAYLPPSYPNTWISPNYVFDYQVPRVVYVPVAMPVRVPQAVIQPVQVEPVTLRRGTALANLQVTPGTVVTWNNADNQTCNLVVAQSTSSENTGTASQTWQIRAKGSFSLALNQPGTYEYITHFVGTWLEEPAHRARIIISG
jgi:hypothetical protein